MRKKTLFFFIALGFFLAATPLAGHKARAIEPLGNYIAVKADPDDMISKELWTFKSTAGTSGSFRVNTASYTSSSTTYQCALFVTNENGLNVDDNQVVWARNESIIGSGGNLNTGMSGFVNCCENATGACGASNCDWTGARKTFNAPFGTGWSDKCSGSDCNLSVSDTNYRPRGQILCMDTWQLCSNSEGPSCLDGTWLCDSGRWQKCEAGCKDGACIVASELKITASPTSASVAAGGIQNITFTVTKDGAAVQGARVNADITGGGSLNMPACNTNISGKCSIAYTAPATAGIAEVEATASYTGVESDPVTITITINATACPTGAHINFDSGSYEAGDTMTLEGLITPSGTMFSLCLYNPLGEKESSAEGRMVAGLNPIEVTAQAYAGTWTGIIKTGLTCANTLSVGDTCRVTATVEEADGTGGEGGSGGGSGDGSGGGTETPQADQPLPSIARCDTNAWIFCNPLAGTIENLTEAGTKSAQALLGLIGTIALLFLIIAGITYMTAAGDEEKIKRAKRIITGTIIGLGIALISFSLLQAILDMLNGA